MSLTRVREAIRYIRQSPARLQRFKTCVEKEKIESKALLRLDVPTRWNSTYQMLEVALRFERAFERYHEEDPCFERDLLEGDGGGRPMDFDWVILKGLVQMLQIFYRVTLTVSGTISATSNVYLHDISEIAALLNEWVSDRSPYPEFREMVVKMKEKWDKYWGNPDKLNFLIFFAMILDPRCKFGLAEFALEEMFGEEKTKLISRKMKDKFFELFNEYSERFNNGQLRRIPSEISGSSSSHASSMQPPSLPRAPVVDVTFGTRRIIEKYKQKKQILGVESKTELDRYWDEDPEADDVDVLKWWSVNSGRYPILASMSREILAILISTVASESTFSTGGRVLDEFRSSLAPSMVEGLICLQDWIRLRKGKQVVDDLEEVEKLQEEFAKIDFAPPIIDIPN
ncbi:zinc finger BED domain-containing protein RICESLEEPER 2-like [Canna indica]|uniref:Zinc finger BED domain-containing protein RICESLEEPER 2-like n=1 Tax=Canna indica TaxID=4628 RepID=A0AAQ3KIM1_9LILI|nr:zinc finger BED domain-containing protein RICESLEEPER 2-like [Canna indica]